MLSVPSDLRCKRETTELRSHWEKRLRLHKRKRRSGREEGTNKAGHLGEVCRVREARDFLVRGRKVRGEDDQKKNRKRSCQGGCIEAVGESLISSEGHACKKHRPEENTFSSELTHTAQDVYIHFHGLPGIGAVSIQGNLIPRPGTRALCTDDDVSGRAAACRLAHTERSTPS